MTFRSVIIGVLGAVLIAGTGYINDEVLGLNRLVGNHFPISVFGALLLLVVWVNPVLFAFRKRWRFSPKELAVMVGLTLIGCTIPGSGLMRTFTASLAMPIHYNQTNTGWQDKQVLSYAPPRMLPCEGKYDPDVIGSFVSGLGKDGSFIPLRDVPWWGWRDPLMVWVPLIFLMGLSMICMGLIVHRQWSHHERLRYPIAEFATSLMQQDPDRPFGAIFRNRLFWAGLLTVTFIHVINGLHVWFPGFVKIPLNFAFPQLLERFPGLMNVEYGRHLARLYIYPCVIGFSFFLASEVTLSLGLSLLVYVLVGWCLVNAGVEVSGTDMNGGVFMWQRFGSYLGIALLLLYLGRRYYADVTRRVFGFRSNRPVAPSVTWAGRILLIAVTGAVALLCSVGLDWPVGLTAVVLILLIVLVIARLNAETGLFFCEPLWHPSAVMIGLFGYLSLGPKALAGVCLLTAVFTINARESLMGFVVNALKMSDTCGTKPSRVGFSAVGVFALALLVAVPVVLWADYSHGSLGRRGSLATRRLPKMIFDAVEKSVVELRNTDKLEESESLSTWERIKNIRPDRSFLIAAGIGFAAVAVFSFLRLRYTWFPLHPVLFLVWGTYPMRHFASSFMLGWFIKTLVVRLGGRDKYNKAKALMIGVIAGDVFGALIFMGVGAIYYAVTGFSPENYLVFPR